MMNAKDLLDFVNLVKDDITHELQFAGFSQNSINFFDSMPSESLAPEWFADNHDLFQEYLKPEFIKLIADLCNILSKIDRGMEDDYSGSRIIGKERRQWGVNKGDKARITGHHWGALHTKNVDKREDIQFFINLTSYGLRVGIYNGKYSDNNRWKAFVTRLHDRKDIIFEEYQSLEKLGYDFIFTSNSDYFLHSIGDIHKPKTASEMYDLVCENKKLGVIKLISKSEMSSNKLLQCVLECFVDTRKLYELLQPSKFDYYKRELTNKQCLDRIRQKYEQQRNH